MLLSALQRRPHLAGFLSGHTDEVIEIAYSADGRMVGSSSSDKSVKLWDMATREAFGPVLKGMYGISVRPDGEMLASADGEAVTLWTIPGGKPEVKLHFAGDMKLTASRSMRMVEFSQPVTSLTV